MGKTAEVLTDMILHDLAQDASKSFEAATDAKKKKTATSTTTQSEPVEEHETEILKGNNASIDVPTDEGETYTDDGGSDFIEESLELENNDVVGGLGNTLDGGGAVVLNTT